MFHSIRLARWRRPVGAALATLCLSLGTVAVVAAPAAAAPCKGNSCNGLDPQSTGCAGSQHGTVTTRYSSSSTYHTYQLRRSAGCRATWGRYFRDNCSYPESVYRWIRVHTQLQSPYGWYDHKIHSLNASNNTTCSDSTWTKMAPAQSGTRARLCWGQTPVSGGSTKQPSSWSCSSWYSGANT